MEAMGRDRKLTKWLVKLGPCQGRAVFVCFFGFFREMARCGLARHGNEHSRKMLSIHI